MRPLKDNSKTPLSTNDGEELSRPEAVPQPLPEPDDPFHPDSLRISQEYLAQAVAKKLLTTVPVKKPSRQDFIRVHPDYRHNAALIELREERETYLVHPKFYPEVEETLRSLYTIYLAINRQKVVFLWPVKLPGPDGRQTAWHTSASDCAERAMKNWVRVAANMSLGAYEVSLAETRLAEPEWPEAPFPDLLRIGFKNRIIDGPDHPVMLRLRGVI
jgi:hypothetical protein